MEMEIVEKRKRGKQALGKCGFCGSTRKALYEKKWRRWIVVGCYCPNCGQIEWNTKHDPPARASREFQEFWQKHKQELEKWCDKCMYKKQFYTQLDELQKKLSSL
jgi:hypothetical protein